MCKMLNDLKITNKIEYKHIDKDFRSIENNYNTEFLRDWNLDSTLLDINNQFNKTQNQSSAELIISKKNIGSKFPKYENILCFGKNLSKTKKLSKLNLKYILDAYEQSNNKDKFFNNYFIKLAGISELKEQVLSLIHISEPTRPY